MSRFRSPLFAAVLAGTLLVAGGCSDLPSAPAAELGAGLVKIAAPASPARSLSGEAVVAKVIGPTGGTLATASGHRIVFPAGAIARPTEISIRDDGTYLGVHLEPHGLRFPAGRSPVLTLDVNGAETAGYDALHVVYVDDAGGILEVLSPTVASGSVSASLRHFSGYMVAGN